MLVAAGSLIAANAAEAKIDVTTNGYFNVHVGAPLADNEDVFEPGGGTSTINGPGPRIVEHSVADVQTDGEIHFNASTELDNGIKLRAHIELETGDAGFETDYIDEQYVIVRGNFGQLTIGSEDVAPQLMTLGYSGSWATQVGLNNNLDAGRYFGRPYVPKNTVFDIRLAADISNDADQISYFTPRFAGFQFGVSYIPNQEQDQSGSPASTDAQYHDGFGIGANFDRKFDMFGIGTGVGYTTFNAPSNWVDAKDAQQWNAALRLDFGPFRIAGAVRKVINFMEGDTKASTTRSGTIYDIGGRLTFGPNAFSLTYANGYCHCDRATGDDRERQVAILSYARTLAPGVKWAADILYGNFEGDAAQSVVDAAIGPGGKQDYDGFAINTSLSMNF